MSYIEESKLSREVLTLSGEEVALPGCIVLCLHLYCGPKFYLLGLPSLFTYDTGGSWLERKRKTGPR